MSTGCNVYDSSTESYDKYTLNQKNIHKTIAPPSLDELQVNEDFRTKNQ